VGALLDTNASCNPVPLPERLYAGGATSHRGFPINGAGPRDLQTGFPVGGSAVLINSFELRLPAPVLPYVGDSVSFVLIHDMGNVFQHVSDMFPSIGRYHQPNVQTCSQISGGIAFGTCNFNYFDHAVGLGTRYKTPVGPLRLDLMYNLNPPVYPIIPTQNPDGTYVNGAVPSVGKGSHFQFFFSIGQSF
jgi:outer membrane protein assembly factor BamA